MSETQVDETREQPQKGAKVDRVPLGVRVLPWMKRRVVEEAARQTEALGVEVSERWVVERALEAYFGCGDGDCTECTRGEDGCPAGRRAPGVGTTGGGNADDERGA